MTIYEDDCDISSLLIKNTIFNMIKAGNKFFCTDTVVMSTGIIAYKIGNIYSSEKNGCITDEQGNKEHLWGYPNPHFKQVSPDSKIEYIDNDDPFYGTSIRGMLAHIVDCIDVIYSKLEE